MNLNLFSSKTLQNYKFYCYDVSKKEKNLSTNQIIDPKADPKCF